MGYSNKKKIQCYSFSQRSDYEDIEEEDYTGWQYGPLQNATGCPLRNKGSRRISEHTMTVNWNTNLLRTTTQLLQTQDFPKLPSTKGKGKSNTQDLDPQSENEVYYVRCLATPLHWASNPSHPLSTTKLHHSIIDDMGYPVLGVRHQRQRQRQP